jgi:hypothetical protein
MKRAGARTRIANVAWGDGARDIHLYGVFKDIEDGARAFVKLSEDPQAVALRTESENDPASIWEGPLVWRCAYGEPQPSFPVILQREYEVDRRHLKSALGLLPEVQALMPNVPILGVVPAIDSQMGRLLIAYYAASLVELGQNMDKFGTSESFQAILVRAAEHGKLTKSRVVVNV